MSEQVVQPPKKSETIQNRFIIFVVVIFAALVLYISYTQSIWLDEGLSIQFSRKSIPDIVLLSMKIDLHPPLYYLLLHTSELFFKKSIFIDRLWSVLCYIGTALLIHQYIKSKELFTSKYRFVAVLLFLLSPFALFYASEVRSYSLIILISLLQFIYYEKLLDSSRPLNALWYTILSVVSVYLFYPFIFSLIGQFVYILFEKRKKFKIFLLPWAAVFLSYLPWMVLVVLKRLGTVPSHFLTIPWWQIPAIIFVGFSGGRTAITDLNHVHWYWPTVMITLVNMLAFTGIVWWKKHEKEKQFLRMLAYLFLVPLVVCLVVSATRFSIFDPRYYAQLFYIFILGLIYSLYFFKEKSARLGLVACCLVFAIDFLFLGLYMFNPWFVREPWKTVVPILESQMHSEDAVVFIGNFQPPPTYSAYQTKDVKVIGTYPDDLIELNDYQAIENHLQTELVGVKRIWYSQYLEWQKDPQQIIRRMVEKEYVYKGTLGFFKVQFDLYEHK